MERKELAEEIVEFCSNHQLFNTTEKVNASTRRIEQQLETSWFVEYLIELFITKARYKENVDFKKLDELLKELEKIRLELECKD